MIESERLAVALAVGFTASFPIAFLLVPDPTGVLPLLGGAVGTAVLVPVLYFVALPRADGFDEEPDVPSDTASDRRE